MDVMNSVYRLNCLPCVVVDITDTTIVYGYSDSLGEEKEKKDDLSSEKKQREEIWRPAEYHGCEGKGGASDALIWKLTEWNKASPVINFHETFQANHFPQPAV